MFICWKPHEHSSPGVRVAREEHSFQSYWGEMFNSSVQCVMSPQRALLCYRTCPPVSHPPAKDDREQEGFHLVRFPPSLLPSLLSSFLSVLISYIVLVTFFSKGQNIQHPK